MRDLYINLARYRATLPVVGSIEGRLTAVFYRAARFGASECEGIRIGVIATAAHEDEETRQWLQELLRTQDRPDSPLSDLWAQASSLVGV